MPRPNWLHMPASAWYGPEVDRQETLFALPSTDGNDDFGTPPFEACIAEVVPAEAPKKHVDR
ncbi:hypothetical protein [Kitasatospora sp. NPDC057223]|uniref:hypothetical protein n=1 Tax=Kitasatospora sp. NPDC057223 TaxID=3346055 RepID=UPI00363DD82F